MPNPRGQPGAMPVSQPCTAMHLTGSRGEGLITASDGMDTSKCPYTCVCNQPRRLGIMVDFRAYIGTEQCMMQNALPCTSEVTA